MPSLWETILKLLLTIDKPSSYANFPTHLVPRFLNLLGNNYLVAFGCRQLELVPNEFCPT